MWVPKSVEEIEAAVRAGTLEETQSFDAKATLPPPRRNRDLAEDVAAMTVAGGVLLYGIGEDAHGKPAVLAPIELSGVRERIDQVVQTSIAEPPYIEVREFDTRGQPNRGYVVVIVPPSP